MNPKHRLKIYIKKAIIRNDFEVVRSGRNTLGIDIGAGMQTITLRNGTPNVIDFITELNAVFAGYNVSWSFDTYSSRVMITNQNANDITLYPETIGGSIIYFDSPLIIPAGSTQFVGKLDLTSEEIVIIRMDNLTSTALNIDQSGNAKGDNILAGILMDAAPYQGLIYRDITGLYGQWCSEDITDIRLSMQTIDSELLELQSDAILVMGIETYRDDESDIASGIQELISLQQLTLVGQDLQRQAPIADGQQ